jgi:hypothetical protein
MTYYIKLTEPWERVPLLTDKSIADYEQSIIPFKGTSYGDVEEKALRGIKLARKLGVELLSVETLDFIEVKEKDCK